MQYSLSFVIFVRSMLRSGIRTLQDKYGDEPIYGPFPESRFQRYKRVCLETILRYTPDWFAYHSHGHFLLMTTRGQHTLDRLAKAIPDRVFRVWQRYSVGLMSLFVTLWVVVAVVWLAASIETFVDVVHTMLTDGIQYDQWESQEPATTDTPSLSETAQSLFWTLLSLPVALVLTNLFLLPLLPGLMLHEFGHYAGLARNEIAVESYGLLLFGPLIGGAFVLPSDELDDAPPDEQLAMLAGGVANDVIYGTVLIGLSLFLFANPVSMIAGGIETMIAQPIPMVLFLFGTLELFMGFVNCFPAGPVDGGKFIAIAEQKYGETK